MCIAGKVSNILELPPRRGILAWRAWRVIAGALLPQYRSDAALWGSRIAKAHRRPTGRRGSDLGIHAVGLRLVSRSGVVGKVRLFGKVVEYRAHSGKVTGYLAEYAEIVGFSVRWSSKDVLALAARYGVKVLK